MLVLGLIFIEYYLQYHTTRRFQLDFFNWNSTLLQLFSLNYSGEKPLNRNTNTTLRASTSRYNQANTRFKSLVLNDDKTAYNHSRDLKMYAVNTQFFNFNILKQILI